MANIKYNGFKNSLAKGQIKFDADNFKLMLVDSTYTPDPDLHEFRSDVTGEVVGTGYIAGGRSLVNKTLTRDDVNDKIVLDADDVIWGNSEIVARGAILYLDKGNATLDTLILYIDFVTDQVSYAGDFIVQWSANGILTLA